MADPTSEDTVILSVSDNVAHVTLNRPDAGNALNEDLANKLAEVAARCDKDENVRCVLLSARGKMFCVGGDLKAIKEAADGAELFVKSIADDLHRAISTFMRMRAPLVIAVQGAAAGAGFSLALTGDHVLASSNAAFTMAYTASGLSPDGGSTYFLPRLVGQRRAQELIFTNRRLSAEEARDWGIISGVTSEDTLMDEAKALAAQLAEGSLAAHGDAKALLLESFDNSLETQMELEGRAIAANAVADGSEGIAAFFEKRKPKFK